MKRSKLIEKLVKIYQTRPEGCSDYHIIDILLGAAEREGMMPPCGCTDIEYGNGCSNFDHCNVWEEDLDVAADSDEKEEEGTYRGDGTIKSPIFEQKIKYLESLDREEMIFILNSYKKYGDISCYIKASKIIQEKLGKLAAILTCEEE